MTEPLACCIMLTKDRPEMAKRAVESFGRQTYQNKRLYIFDTGKIPCVAILPDGYPDFNIVYHRGQSHGASIGALRNLANWWGCRSNSSNPPDADILIHFDDDDWSHPNRITEQVALLQASGKQCVGYRDMIFGKQATLDGAGLCTHCSANSAYYCAEEAGNCALDGQAWLYTNQDPRYCLGTSLCYWRAAWEARPFPDISRGEDRKWLREIDSMGITSFPPFDGVPVKQWDFNDQAPRMIASIHSGNHVKYETTSAEWKRVPEWDAYCRERMAL